MECHKGKGKIFRVYKRNHPVKKNQNRKMNRRNLHTYKFDIKKNHFDLVFLTLR